MPRDVSFPWLAACRHFDFFDVLHIHSVEFAEPATVDDVVSRCHQLGKRVVATVHDVAPMFTTTSDEYLRVLGCLAERGVSLVTLTDGAADTLTHRLGTTRRPTVIPHGHVIDPDHPGFGRAGTSRGGVTFGMYGGFRPNRAMYPVVIHAAYGLPGPDDQLRILTRAISPIELDTDGDARRVAEFAGRDPGRVELRLLPFPDDEDVIDFLTGCDALVMPYRWGSHSGQLETAIDLGLVPVLADVGYFREQWSQVANLAPEPVWFDWNDGNDYAYGPRLLEALVSARTKAVSRSQLDIEAVRRHRRTEHAAIMDAYERLYRAAHQ